MIWDLSLMARVRRLRTQVGVAEEAIVTSGGYAETAAKQRLAEELIRTGHDLGVEIDMRDIGFQERSDLEESFPMSRWYRAAWAPMHGTVELLAGPRDGEVMAVDPQLIDYTGPIRFPQLAYDPVFWDKAGPVPPDVNHLEYRMHGYREETRSWIYKFYP